MNDSVYIISSPTVNVITSSVVAIFQIPTVPVQTRRLYLESTFLKSNHKEMFQKYFWTNGSKLSNSFRGTALFTTTFVTNHILDNLITTNVKNRYERDNNVLSALILSTTVGAVNNPFKAMIMRMQSDNLKTIAAFKQIYKTNAFRGFFAGTSFSIAQSFINMLPHITFSNGEINKLLKIESLVTNSKNTQDYVDVNNIASNMLRGSVLSSIGLITAIPFNVLNTVRLTDPQRREFRSNKILIEHILKEKGVGGFFTGFKYCVYGSLINIATLSAVGSVAIFGSVIFN